jgi:hypothetical protein
MRGLFAILMLLTMTILAGMASNQANSNEMPRCAAAAAEAFQGLFPEFQGLDFEGDMRAPSYDPCVEHDAGKNGKVKVCRLLAHEALSHKQASFVAVLPESCDNVLAIYRE